MQSKSERQFDRLEPGMKVRVYHCRTKVEYIYTVTRVETDRFYATRDNEPAVELFWYKSMEDMWWDIDTPELEKKCAAITEEKY